MAGDKKSRRQLPLAGVARQELHDALDLLLDDADAHDGILDAPAFWGFAGLLAAERGIVDDLNMAAAITVIEHDLPPISEGAEWWRRWQGALLAAFLHRVSAWPGEILPEHFNATAWRSIALNVAEGGKGVGIDLLGLGTSDRGTDVAMTRAAKRLLVRTVMYRAAVAGRSEDSVRRELFPDELDRRTWEDWKRDVARLMRTTVERMRAELEEDAASGRGDGDYQYSDEQIAILWRWAYKPR